MCTLTIIKKSERLIVTMSRDEKKIRAAEKTPFYWENHNIFAPQDSVSEGTWFGVNANNRIACLLNGYTEEGRCLDAKQSRGEIVPLALQNKEADIVFQHYLSFHLLIIDNHQINRLSWDGKNVQRSIFVVEDVFFQTSSGYQQEIVQDKRNKQFVKWRDDGHSFLGFLPSIHGDISYEEGAYNTMMERDDALTKSIVQYDIDNDNATMRYWGDPHKSLYNPKEFDLRKIFIN